MYYCLNFFFIMSLLGHIIENFAYKHIDSGIFYGPWTPIYGIGALLIILIYYILEKTKLHRFIKPILLFIISALTLATLEFFSGLLIEKLFGRVFWDYSKSNFNIGKYTSLEMLLLWGLASIGLIYILKPILDKIIKKIPKFLTIILVLLFIIDLIITLISIGDFLF